MMSNTDSILEHLESMTNAINGLSKMIPLICDTSTEAEVLFQYIPILRENISKVKSELTYT